MPNVRGNYDVEHSACSGSSDSVRTAHPPCHSVLAILLPVCCIELRWVLTLRTGAVALSSARAFSAVVYSVKKVFSVTGSLGRARRGPSTKLLGKLA